MSRGYHAEERITSARSSQETWANASDARHLVRHQSAESSVVIVVHDPTLARWGTVSLEREEEQQQVEVILVLDDVHARRDPRQQRPPVRESRERVVRGLVAQAHHLVRGVQGGHRLVGEQDPEIAMDDDALDRPLDHRPEARLDLAQGSLGDLQFRYVAANGEDATALDPAFLDEFNYGIIPGTVGSDQWIADVAAANAEFAQACLTHTGALLEFVDTVSAARDMDLLRAVLGDEKLNYLGYSYGTTLGSTYAELMPYFEADEETRAVKPSGGCGCGGVKESSDEPAPAAAATCWQSIRASASPTDRDTQGRRSAARSWHGPPARARVCRRPVSR